MAGQRRARAKYVSVILDFALPDAKGDELAETIKLKDPEVKVILLTGFKPAIDQVKLEKFDYIFEKPIDPKKILEVLKLITDKVNGV